MKEIDNKTNGRIEIEIKSTVGREREKKLSESFALQISRRAVCYVHRIPIGIIKCK